MQAATAHNNTGGWTPGAMLVQAVGADTLRQVDIQRLCIQLQQQLRGRLQRRRVELRRRRVCLTMGGRWTHLSTCSTSQGTMDVAFALSLSEERFHAVMTALDAHHQAQRD
jgi:hypothetical protein